MPDAALHRLPWAALRSGGAGEPYLIEERPIHFALSATVYQSLLERRERRRPEGPPLVVSFGGANYPRDSITDEPRLRAAADRGFDFRPLPASEGEARAVARELGYESRVFVAAEATEDAARRHAGDADYLHLAAHGYLDPVSPLDSGIALTFPEVPGEGVENGLWQAWEVLSGAELRARLVTLSACSAAAGQEVGGEGLASLARAFQIAGAGAVVAPLFAVDDAATADLMVAFYDHLGRGARLDDALRHAQLTLLRGETSSSGHSAPAYWAGFQVHGDAR